MQNNQQIDKMALKQLEHESKIHESHGANRNIEHPIQIDYDQVNIQTKLGRDLHMNKDKREIIKHIELDIHVADTLSIENKDRDQSVENMESDVMNLNKDIRANRIGNDRKTNTDKQNTDIELGINVADNLLSENIDSDQSVENMHSVKNLNTNIGESRINDDRETNTDKPNSNTRHEATRSIDEGIIIGNIRVTKSQSGSEVLYENIGAMDLSVDLERVETMEDCIFFDTIESVEDDHIHNFSYDKNSLLDSGINADELLCGIEIDSNSSDNGDVSVEAVDNVVDVDEDDNSRRSSKEDEEVEQIMKSSDVLDRLGSELKRKTSEKRYEDVNIFRKRSKSTDETSTVPSRIDFARYGISIGIGSANDLLPGIEDFLSNVLSKESLSPIAEEQRLYFLERLDIIKLPPSIPPRPQSLSIRLYPLHSSPPPGADPSIPLSADQDDFAAYQRELSRALNSETSPVPDFEDEVKVYDDIDISDISYVHEHSTVQTAEESVYEIPQAKTHNLSDFGYERAKNRTFSDSGYEKAVDVSHVSTKAVSLEGLEVLHSTTIPSLPASLPPPLPPRRDRAPSDAASRSSIGSIFEDKMLELSVKVGQESLNESVEKPQDTRSERSSDDVLDEGADDLDGISYDSMDDTGSLPQPTDVQLPRPTKKRKKSVRRRMVHSLSTMKEVAVPLRNLEDVFLTGELHYRSKLTWTRKMVALTNGRLICYKPDKAENRPSFVILLTGYEASFQKREGKRSFEINLTHENFESHMFLADFKEWAETWCEYIKYAAQGRKPPGPVLNLTRGSSCVFDSPDGTNQLGKSPIGSSGSNLSLASSDGFDGDPGTVKVKKRDSTGLKTARMGSFAYKATQFFESFSKKSSIKKTSRSGSEKARPLSATLSQSSLTEENVTPLTPESGIMLESPLEVMRHIKHQGYLDIYSSFNKRKWGKRWCMIQENNFECYRTQTSEVVELEFMLRDCVLRRAIQETKSELGLMLMENNREKLTIEPLNWTELGSWLRVLMRETSTTDVPDGLAGYMDDTNPYHEAVEVKRLSLLADPITLSPTAAGGVPTFPPNKPTIITKDNGSDQSNARNRNQRNRDSGNCSSESMDGRFGSLDRTNGRSVHPGYTDSSLPRVTMPDSGDIYTQIRKHSVSGSPSKSPSQNQSSQRSQSEGRELLCANKSGNQIFDFNFDVDEVSGDVGTEGSLMDEIMSQFRTHISPTLELDDGADCTDTNAGEGPPLTPYSSIDDGESEHHIPDIFGDKSNTANQIGDFSISKKGTVKNEAINRSHNGNTTTAKHAVTSDKSIDGAHICNDNDFDAGMVAEKDIVKPDDSDSVTSDNEVDIRRKSGLDNTTARKTSSLLYGEKGMAEVIKELRTRLVQLKKDRISIRDRKQKVTSEIDRGYLEAEFNRLNRECDKVAEEIKYLEKIQKLETIVANKVSNKSGANTTTTNVKDIDTKPHTEPTSCESDTAEETDESDAEKDPETGDIVVERVPTVCDDVLVQKKRRTDLIFETVQKSVVSNKDLVDKPNIVVDANVIIVEPDLKELDDCNETKSKGENNNIIFEEHLEYRSQGESNCKLNVKADNEQMKSEENSDDGDTNNLFETLTEFDKLAELPDVESNSESGESDKIQLFGALNENNQTVDLNSSGIENDITSGVEKCEDIGTEPIDFSVNTKQDNSVVKIEDNVNQLHDICDESVANETVTKCDVPNADINEDSSENENGAIQKLAEEFEEKLRLRSESDC